MRGHERSALHIKCLERRSTANPTGNHNETPGDDNFAAAQVISFDDAETCRAAQSHEPSQAEQEMWDDFVLADGAFELEQGAEEREKDARTDFERKASEFGLWGGPETMLEEEIERVEDAWDEAEHDDILTEILQNLGQSTRYTFELKTYQVTLSP